MDGDLSTCAGGEMNGCGVFGGKKIESFIFLKVVNSGGSRQSEQFG